MCQTFRSSVPGRLVLQLSVFRATTVQRQRSPPQLEFPKLEVVRCGRGLLLNQGDHGQQGLRQGVSRAPRDV